jgi:hypothetical protein
MPEAHPDGIEVSAEEERYLRRAFRRFALPYLLLVIAITGAALVWAAAAPRVAKERTPDEIRSLLAEAASLRETIASLREHQQQQAARTGERLEALEGGLDRLRSARADGPGPAELASRLDHAHQRINALEGRLREMEARPVARRAPEPASDPASAPAAAAPPPSEPWSGSSSSFERP